MRMFLLVITLVVGSFVYWQAGGVVELVESRDAALVKMVDSF